MQIIDFHTHFFPDKLFDALWTWFETHAWPIQYKSYSDDLVKILKNEGVTRCVALHYPHKPGMSQALNAWTTEFAGRYSDFVIPFGSVHPDDADKVERLEECFTKYNFKGIKLHCHVQHFAPDDPRLDAVYQTCRDHKRIVLIHCGTGPSFKDSTTPVAARPAPGAPAALIRGYGYDVSEVSGWRRMENVLKKYPDLTFVVPHLGYEEIPEFFKLLPLYPNLHLDTAMALSNFLKVNLKPEWLEKHSDRILFGTDFPHLPYSWNHELEELKKMGLSQKASDQILWQNAATLLGLDL